MNLRRRPKNPHLERKGQVPDAELLMFTENKSPAMLHCIVFGLIFNELLDRPFDENLIITADALPKQG